MLFAIGIRKSASYQVTITDNLHLVNIKHINGVVKYVVQVVEELDSLAGRAQGCQLGEPNNITKEQSRALIQPNKYIIIFLINFIILLG